MNLKTTAPRVTAAIEALFLASSARAARGDVEMMENVLRRLTLAATPDAGDAGSGATTTPAAPNAARRATISSWAPKSPAATAIPPGSADSTRARSQ